MKTAKIKYYTLCLGIAISLVMIYKAENVLKICPEHFKGTENQITTEQHSYLLESNFVSTYMKMNSSETAASNEKATTERRNLFRTFLTYFR